MNQAISPIEDKDEVDLTCWIQAAALRMENDADFPELLLQVVDRIKAAGLQVYALSIYLLAAESKSDWLHYTLSRGEVSWLQDELYEDGAEFGVHDTKEAQSWLDTQSETAVAYLCVPTSTGVLTIADERAEPFSDEQQALLQTLVPAIEMLVIRHRDLAAYAVVNEAYLQTRSRLINSNPDLMALQDGSFDLSAESVDEVAQNMLEFITQRLQLDRGGIFLRDGDILRGFWGMDEEGAIIAIPNTIFPLYPEENKELTHIALIARGEKQYYLTQDLAADVGGSISHDFGANVAVPMRVGGRIIGALAGDNFVNKRPISYDQMQALMVLANQGAVMIEMVKLQKKLIESNKMASIGVMSSGIAHELSQPLAAILLKTQLIPRLIEKKKYALIKKTGEDVVTQTLRAKKIIDSLRVISREERDEDREKCDLNSLVEDVLTLFMDGFKLSNVNLELMLTTGEMLVFVSPVQIGQVLSALLINAQDAVENSNPKKVIVRTDRVNDSIVLEVSDNGCGISKNSIGRIFDPFYTTKSVGKGTGLGLSLGYSMIQENGGKLTVSSEEGKGAKFRVVIPAINEGCL
ncbi:MAG: GAF domain-containing protein [Gemmatimonadetes bacterium]|jgi:signal transduction histidine kinase|nr:GAF domain-containing protein [Gemmatimonadota bacterium]